MCVFPKGGGNIFNFSPEYNTSLQGTKRPFLWSGRQKQKTNKQTDRQTETMQLCAAWYVYRIQNTDKHTEFNSIILLEVSIYTPVPRWGGCCQPSRDQPPVRPS